MTRLQKMLLALITLAVFAGLVEGIARIIWWRLEVSAFAATKAKGEEVLRNDGINFMKEVDGVYGYVLKPDFDRGGMFINAQGFAQRDTVPVERVTSRLRVVAMGESTTQGHNTDTANYPVYLRSLLEKLGEEHAGVEVINAGVSGWVSDQIALRAERELAAYQPDIVLLYMGWNDFQSYDPLSAPPSKSYFAQAYSGTRLLIEESGLRSIALLSSLYAKWKMKFETTTESVPKESPTPETTYRFYLQSLDRVVNAYRHARPTVIIAICTLTSRWPQGTREQFDANNGHVWWMDSHRLDPQDAARNLARFNELIRQYARSRDLILIDVESAFEKLDRGQLFRDFAHVHAEGYELFAEAMYETLRQTGVIHGRQSSRYGELMTKYRRRDSTMCKTCSQLVGR